MENSVPATVLRPVFPVREEILTTSLVVKNEGSRALQVIGDHVEDGERILPGCSYDIDIAQLGGPVQLTFYDGGIQVDRMAPSAPGGEIEAAPGSDEHKPAGAFAFF